jgi:dihydroxyacetone kinase-like protein
MDAFNNREGAIILDRLIDAIRENKQYLSDIDGAIGDGDHGVNMNKGFAMTREALAKEPGDFSHGLLILAKILMMRIGGSMGPLYGKMFKTMGKCLADQEEIDAVLFARCLAGVRESMSAFTPAKVGDKTLVDALYPAIDSYEEAISKGAAYKDALEAMKKASAAGRDATEHMIAKLGRSSRLGERSRGVIDAGAASCALILGVMADTIIELL